MTPSRRGFLGSVAATATVALTGCGSVDGPKVGGQNTSSAPVDVPTSDVPLGSGTILTNAAFVITQPSSGQFKAFSSICTHMECPVSKIKGNEIVCNCHGSRFSITDGSVTNGPATRPLTPAKVQQKGNTLHVSES